MSFKVYLPTRFPRTYVCFQCLKEIKITQINIEQKDISNGFFVSNGDPNKYVGFVCSKSCAVALFLLNSKPISSALYQEDVYIGDLNDL